VCIYVHAYVLRVYTYSVYVYSHRIYACARVSPIVYNTPYPCASFPSGDSPSSSPVSPIPSTDILARRPPVYPGDVAGCYIIAGRCCQLSTRGAAVLPSRAGVPCRSACLPALLQRAFLSFASTLERNPPHKTEFNLRKKKTYGISVPINALPWIHWYQLDIIGSFTFQYLDNRIMMIMRL